MLLLAGISGSIDFHLMRLLIFIGITYLANNLVKEHKVESGKEALYFYGYIFIAILFNPIIPVYLYDRGKWLLIDVLVIIFILSQNYFISKNQIANKKQKTFLEEYNSLPPRRKREYLDELLEFDQWSSSDSWFDVDIEQIKRDAINDVIIDLDYDSCINYDLKDSMRSDNQYSNNYTSQNNEITAVMKPKKENENENEEVLDFNVGDKIYDSEWGIGTLVSIEKNENEYKEFAIAFSSIGLKSVSFSEFQRRKIYHNKIKKYM